MSALALAFKRQGHEKLPDGRLVPSWKVTGSDVGFYPPISTYLKEAGVDYYAGWHPDKMIALGTPDLVVVGNVASSRNAEWLYVQEHGLNYKSYPEVIAENIIKKNSIVCAGTYGKTTSTALLTWILKEAEYDPNYMFGGVSLNNLPAAEIADSNWSVVEGDEYKASRWDQGPKFAYYSPTHLLLTSVVWDHADVYPTEKLYIEAFKNLIKMVPNSGVKVISEKAINTIHYTHKTIQNLVTYGKNPPNDYVYTNIVKSKNGLQFEIIHEHKKYSIKTTCLGEYMADNITGCFALATEIGIPAEKIITAIANFKSLKRRLEKRYDGAVAIFDDIAHSPSKAMAILKTLRETYSGKIYGIFEPNTGNRKREAIPWYDNAFANADEIIIPRLTKIKTNPKDSEQPIDGFELADIIGKTHSSVRYIEDDDALLDYIKQKIQPGDAVVFMGSHGFRGMIETLVNAIG